MFEQITKEKIVACVAAVAVATTSLSLTAHIRSKGSANPTNNPLKAFSVIIPPAPKIGFLKRIKPSRQAMEDIGLLSFGTLLGAAGAYSVAYVNGIGCNKCSAK